MISNSGASILARLKNESKKEGIAFQQLLNLFFQEEFIRRLAQSKYREQLILKGGFLLYAISNFKGRPTVDADYLLQNHSNDLDSVENMVQLILNEKTSNEFMEIVIRSIEKIGEVKEYHGIHIHLEGHMGNTRTPFSVDFGVGDIIFPSVVARTIPVILDEFKKPEILTYSLESTISEKLDAIIRFMEATGRMKDFYDIFYLATSFEFEGRKLQEAIEKTFRKRETSYEIDSIQVIKRLITNEAIINRWDNFCKKILKYELSLDEVIQLIIFFVDPPFQAMIQKDDLLKNWNSVKKCYE